MQVRPSRRRSRDPDRTSSSLVIHTVVVGAHRTTIRLEPQMWDALKDIAQRRRMTIHDLVTSIAEARSASSLTAAIRVYIVDFYRAAASAEMQPRATPASRLQM
jgi:predicted DNA-binding ribbon-helix-helix protein